MSGFNVSYQMNKNVLIPMMAALMVTAAFAAPVKTYQVTGPVLDVSDSVIVVQKGDERWELARTPDTKVKRNLVKGAKVTIFYTMTAVNVEVK
jgi:hypothetical protein